MTSTLTHTGFNGLPTVGPELLYDVASSSSIRDFSCEEAITTCWHLPPGAQIMPCPRVQIRAVVRRSATISATAACLIGIRRTTPDTRRSQPVELMRLRAHEDSANRPPRPDPAWMSPCADVTCRNAARGEPRRARTPSPRRESCLG